MRKDDAVTTPLERDIAASESRGDLGGVDELNVRQLADVIARADANGHVRPPARPHGACRPTIPRYTPRTAGRSNAIGGWNAWANRAACLTTVPADLSGDAATEAG